MEKAITNGKLILGSIVVPCAVLEDETRVLARKSIAKVLGVKGGGSYWIDTAALPEICNLWIKADQASTLTEKQLKIAVSARILLKSFANIGIIALIDEATNYQENRKKDALRFLVEQYIIEEARAWTKEFYDEFFIELDRIYGNQRTVSKNRPKYYGKFINKYIYESIENGKGLRKNRMHQFLSDAKGLRTLRDRISKITALLQVSSNKLKFESAYERMESKQMWFDFDDE